MRALTKHRVKLKRFIEGYWNEEGDYVEAGDNETMLPCCVQPHFKGRPRYIEVEGVRHEDYLTLYTRFELFTANEKLGRSADEIFVRGQWYEVKKVEEWWGLNSLSHFEACLVEKDKGL